MHKTAPERPETMSERGSESYEKVGNSPIKTPRAAKKPCTVHRKRKTAQATMPSVISSKKPLCSSGGQPKSRRESVAIPLASGAPSVAKAKNRIEITRKEKCKVRLRSKTKPCRDQDHGHGPASQANHKQSILMSHKT